MFFRFNRFLARHPALRDALLWVLPAIIFGAALRLMMLHYSPYAYWGADSFSYYEFTHRFAADYSISLNEKRRVLYPILMAMVTVLPGVPLQWLAWLQHGFGLLTLVPLAYVMRKTFTFWRWWTIPVTVLYAGLPVVLWYEHELLGETLFFAFVVWAFAGWIAWAKEPQRERAARLWWLFFAPFALLILTKPSARFFWPGLLIGLVLVVAWRKLRPIHYAALAALMVVTLNIGSTKQGKWFLYVASFPLTQLDTPLHAEYKAEIRDMVAARRERLDYYYREDREPFLFTRNPRAFPERQLWATLAKDGDRCSSVYMALSLEAIKAEPLNFLYLGLQRTIFSANLSDFKEGRFEADYFPVRFQSYYDKAVEHLEKDKQTPIPLALGFPVAGPLPPFEEVARQLSPAPESASARLVMAWVKRYEAASDLVRAPKNSTVAQARPTMLGYWLLLGIALSFTGAYRSTAGVWTLAALGYLAGVFLVSEQNPRYFGAVWPVFFPLLAVPADFLCRTGAAFLKRRTGRREEAPAESV